MPKQCEITGKTRNKAYSISHSHVRTKKIQKVNMHTKKVWCIVKCRWVRMKVSTKAIKQLPKVI